MPIGCFLLGGQRLVATGFVGVIERVVRMILNSIHQAFLSLGCALIGFKQLQRFG